MSDVRAFLELLADDPELQDLLRQVEDANRDVTLKTVTALAATRGLTFTQDELRQALETGAGTELEENELEKVAGGLVTPIADLAGLKFLPASIQPTGLKFSPRPLRGG